MSSPPLPPPVRQTISGAHLLGRPPSWFRRQGWPLTLIIAAIVVGACLFQIVDQRAERAAQQAAYVPPQLSEAEKAVAATHAREKAGSDALAAAQAYRDTAAAEAAAEGRAVQDQAKTDAPDENGRP